MGAPRLIYRKQLGTPPLGPLALWSSSSFLVDNVNPGWFMLIWGYPNRENYIISGIGKSSQRVSQNYDILEEVLNLQGHPPHIKTVPIYPGLTWVTKDSNLDPHWAWFSHINVEQLRRLGHVSHAEPELKQSWDVNKVDSYIENGSFTQRLLCFHSEHQLFRC